MTDIPENFESPFQEIVDIGNARLTTICKKFENGGYEKLITKWQDYYLEKYSAEITDPAKFLIQFRENIQWYWDYLSEKVSGDRWELYDKAGWIREKYNELLSDNGDNSPKQETIIRKVGAKAKVLNLLNRFIGKK